MSDERLAAAIDGAYSKGYVDGARSGRLAAFVWGLLLGSIAVVAALKLGIGTL